jgi:Na+-transporting NADH:ubiquinone oxidoreductase subunit NqrC
MNISTKRRNSSTMSSLANVILFLALVTTSVMVAVMYVKLKKFDRYHAEYQQIFDRTGDALKGAQTAVMSFGAEGKETLALLGSRIEEAKAVAAQLETLTREASRQAQSRSNSLNS